MTTTVPSAALVTIRPVFAEPERLALAGSWPYRGLTREASSLDGWEFTR